MTSGSKKLTHVGSIECAKCGEEEECDNTLLGRYVVCPRCQTMLRLIDVDMGADDAFYWAWEVVP